MGNAGLTAAAGSGTRVARLLRACASARVDRESTGVTSLSLAAADGSALPGALPGQFLVLRVRIKPDLPPILRSYSMSGAPGADGYRVSVKRETDGMVSAFLCDDVTAGDDLDVSAPRGTFTLRPGDGPVVLLSAGIGATPTLAMLHALAGPGACERPMPRV